MLPIFGMRTYGKKTAAAGTAIVQLIEPMRNLFTRIGSLWYTNAGTAHLMTIRRPFAKTTITAAAAASQAVVNLAANPGLYAANAANGAVPSVADNTIAGSDYVVYEMADGTYVLDTVSSLATLALTLTTNLGTGGVAAGATLWFYGAGTDLNPNTGAANPTFDLAASVTTKFGADAGETGVGFFGSIPGIPALGMTGKYEPLIVSINNVTAAGVLDKITALYTTF